jgi:hypothetical protein
VLFDVNRTIKFGALLRPSAETALTRLLPPEARSYRTSIITNAEVDSSETVERTVEAGDTTEHTRMLEVSYPAGLYSLSHVALPFPMNDALYGLAPDPAEDFGINLGALAPRGERNVLVASLDALLRVASNPFFPYMIGRIEESIDSRPTSVSEATGVSSPPPTSDLNGETSAWSFDELIKYLTQNRYDPSPEPP